MKLTSTFRTAAVIALVMGMAAFGAHSADRLTQRGAKLHGDGERGRVVFSTWCVSCHADSSHATDQIPTVQQLAAAPARTDDAVRGFLSHPHRPMPPLELENQQIEDIVAYLHDLKAAAVVPQPPGSP